MALMSAGKGAWKTIEFATLAARSGLRSPTRAPTFPDLVPSRRSVAGHARTGGSICPWWSPSRESDNFVSIVVKVWIYKAAVADTQANEDDL